MIRLDGGYFLLGINVQPIPDYDYFMLAVLEMRFVGCWLWVSHQAASRWRLRVPAELAVDLRVLLRPVPEATRGHRASRSFRPEAR